MIASFMAMEYDNRPNKATPALNSCDGDTMNNWIETAFELFKKDTSDDDTFHQLLAAGCERRLAERLLCFFPLACGRIVLADLVEFPGEYASLQAHGKIGPARSLRSDPDWIAIELFLTTRQQTEASAISRIGMRSAEFDAINKALLNGSEPKNLVLSKPIFTFVETETLTTTPVTSKPKPWWAFWR